MNRKKAHLLAVLAMGITSGVLFSAATRAQSNEQEELQKRFQEGKVLFDQKKFAEARVKFVQACAILETTNCPKNLALTEIELSMWPDAANHLQQWMDDPRTKGDPVRSEIERVFTDTKTKVGEIDLDVDLGARVRIDGKLVGTSPITKPIFVAPGDHEVEANWSISSKSSKVSLFAGKAVKVDLHQDPALRGDPPDAGAAPPPSASAPPPPPSVTAPPPPSATAPPPPSASVALPPEPPPKSKGPAIAVGGILTAGGVLGFVGFAAFAAGSNSSKDQADAYANTGVCVNQEDPRCLDYKSKRDSQGTQHTLSIISLVSGLIFLAGGVSLLVFAATSKKAAPVHIGPQVSSTGFSLDLGGSF